MYRPLALTCFVLLAGGISAQDKATPLMPAESGRFGIYWQVFKPAAEKGKWLCSMDIRNNSNFEAESVTVELFVSDATRRTVYFRRDITFNKFVSPTTMMSGTLRPNHQDVVSVTIPEHPSFAKSGNYWYVLKSVKAYKTVKNPKAPAHFFSAIARKDLAAVKKMVDATPSLANAMDPSGYGTAMHEAAWLGDLKMFKYLESKGGDIRRFGKLGYQPFHVAAASWSQDVVKYLLSKGIKADAPTKKGFTALAYASSNAAVECVKVLMNAGAKVSMKMPDGTTALHHAVMDPKMAGIYPNEVDQVVKLLAKSGGSVKAADKSGRTPLCFAAASDNLRGMRLLVSLGADVNQASPPSKRTPLHYAAIADSYYGVSELLAQRADPMKKDAQGKTAYDYAAKHKRPQVADQLMIAMKSKARPKRKR